MTKLKIGVSSCLLGNKVRYDSGHKNNKLTQELFNDNAELIAFCPEVAIGMTIPRSPIRLVQKEQLIDVVDPKTNKSYLNDLLNYANNVDFSNFDGIVFKKDSPSCGAFRVKTYLENGHRIHSEGQGGFARRIMERYPEIPIEEEGRLTNPLLRDNFVQRVFLYNEIKQVQSMKDLIAFHSYNKFLFYSYDQNELRHLGRLIGKYKKNDDFYKLKKTYQSKLMLLTSKPPKKGNHVNALMHVYGFIKTKLSKEEKYYVLELIKDYNENKKEITEPLSVLKFLISNKGSDYIKMQSLLKELHH